MAGLRKTSIGLQIFVATISVALSIILIWVLYGFYVNIHSVRSSVDFMLETSASEIVDIVSEDALNKILENEISPKEYFAAQKKLLDFQEKALLSSVYIVAKSPNGYLLRAITVFGEPMSPVKIQSPEMVRALESGETLVFLDKNDVDGLDSRVAVSPKTLKNGAVVAGVAGVDVVEYRPIIMSSLKILAALGAAALAIALAVTAALSKRISRPISKLSEFTHKLAESNFSPELSLEKTLKKSEIGTSDVFSLAKNISLMQKKLGEYISNLERESRARELAETELKIAGKIQAEFLPGKEYESAGVEICANMRPARQAAGDLYDYFPLDDGRLSMSVGDVSGKGIAAALFMAKADTILRASANLEKSLPKMASRINAALCANNDSCMFLTLFMCAFNFETRELGYVCCGHNPPIVKRANGETFFLKCRPNIALGLDENAEFARETVFLERGDTLFIYTDGATEAESKNGEFFGEERLLNCVKNAPGSPREICESVLRDLDAFALGAEQSDDITILSAKIK